MLLLSDGTVMAEGGNISSNWYRLTPDSTGGYTNGMWTQSHSMNYTRLYCSSDVLTNGQVFFAGAEYGTGTTNVESYDPVSDSWTILPFPSNIVYVSNNVPSGAENDAGFLDSDSVVLSNGKVLTLPVYPLVFGETAIYDPVATNWTKARIAGWSI